MRTGSLVLGGLVVVAAVAFGGCSSGPAAGTERGACYPNGTCNAGLSCLSGLCVVSGADAGVDVPRADAPGADAPMVDAVGTDAVAMDATGTDVVGTDATVMDVAAMDAAADVGRTDAGATDAFVEGGIPCPGAVIFHPGPECRVVGTSVPFVGHARTPTCEVLVGGALTWSDDLEGSLGSGEMVNHTFTIPGTHTVTLTATLPGGGTQTATVSFPIRALCM